MPLFFTLSIAAAAILLGASAADGRWWRSSHGTMALAFDASPYRTVAECLRGAHQAGVPSAACAGNR